MATFSELLTALQGAAAGNAAVADDAAPYGQGYNDVWRRDYGYLYLDSGVIKEGASRAIGLGADPATADAYWLGSVPVPLRVASTPDYLSGRTVGEWAGLSSAQRVAAIENFCNAVWATVEINPDPILDFSVRAVEPNIVEVSGLFHVGTNWEPRRYTAKLIDPNGGTTPASGNVEFRRIIEPTVTV